MQQGEDKLQPLLQQSRSEPEGFRITGKKPRSFQGDLEQHLCWHEASLLARRLAVSLSFVGPVCCSPGFLLGNKREQRRRHDAPVEASTNSTTAASMLAKEHDALASTLNAHYKRGLSQGRPSRVSVRTDCKYYCA
jgi:hypothetical protein